MSDLTEKTIEDFGAQWTRYQDNEGFYASSELLLDVCGPLLAPSDLVDRRAMEIGSGTGRIVQMLLDLGAGHVVAVEPSAAMDVLKNNTKQHANRITYAHVTGENLPDDQVDYAFSIGVLHHIPRPEPVVRRVYQVLAPGGKFLFWVYGREGNGTYLFFVQPLRALTKLMPDWLLGAFSHLICFFTTLYIYMCRIFPLPLHRYMREVLGKFDWKRRALVIFDQLNPGHAKYYRRDEALQLMQDGGFENVRIYHRHGYSWTVLGEKPIASD